MQSYTTVNFKARRLTQAVSLALATLVSGTAAAQTVQVPAPAPATPAGDKEVNTVLVVGARASQQSAIQRKKNADTAQDSIIAEDVGAFPDRNVADAISRIAGVSVDRGDFGEGVTVSIRGNGPDLTRVEIDGQGVQAAGGTNMLGGITAGTDGGRGVEMRQLSSDLIKSVDVVKGSTADMTEGSLGGGVIIKTRNGLDFKKDYMSLRVAATQGSLNKEVNPDLNFVASKKFLDNRLGLIVNVSKSKAANEAHSITQGGVSNISGPVHSIDFDNSPNKTFSFQPSTLRDTPEANNPYLVSTTTSGGTFNSASPADIVNKSASAKTKADCYAAFPLLTAAQSNVLTSGNNRTNAINQRQNELLTCLGQWADWTPSQVRYFVNREEDRRISGDMRLDFKVTDNLSIYGMYRASEGKVNHYTQSMSLGGIGIGTASTPYGLNGYSGPTYTETLAPQANGASAVRTLVPASGYSYYPDLVYRGANSPSGILGAANGTVVNVVPGSVKVDANHRVTSAELSDGFYGVDGTVWEMKTESTYLQGGGTYKNGGFKADLLLGDTSSKFYRFEKRASVGFNIGKSTYSVGSDGLWAQSVADTSFDPLKTSNYITLVPQAASAAVAASATTPAIPAYTAAQKPLVNGATTLPFQNARTSETSEKTAKLDLSYAVQHDWFPFISTLKGGVNLRDTGTKFWGTGGYNVSEPVGTFGTASYVPGVYVPNVNLRSTVQVCQDTPGSLAPGGQPCKYGYNPSTNPASALQGSIVVTPDQYNAALKEAISQQPWATFYNGIPDRSPALTNGWIGVDVEKFYKALGVPNYDLNCIKSCVASDGKTYPQPMLGVDERVRAAYLMTNFEFDRVPYTGLMFPFGINLDGNFGYRMVNTKVKGTGVLTFNSIKKTAAYNPLDPNNSAGISTLTYRKSTDIDATTTDYMPSLNLGLWLIPDQLVLRYNQAKTVARPGYGRLVPNGTCTYDERFVGQLDGDGTEKDQVCSGVMGNPAVQALTNKNKNLSLEWYANKDTMFAVSTYRQVGLIGAPTLDETIKAAKLFAGSNLVDQQTGLPLADLEFNYRQWTNQLPATRTGLELSSKTAFTFLPWYLRYTGLDANYTRNKSSLNGTSLVRDLLTGDVMPVSGEAKYSYNWSLWYDDGRLSARFAVQVVSDIFNCVSGCNGTGVRNYPAFGITTVQSPVYSPGPPSFKRGTRYMDAKIGYKITPMIELFAEGRNLGRTRTGNTTGSYDLFADGTPNVYTDAYAGSKFMIGLNFKNQ